MWFINKFISINYTVPSWISFNCCLTKYPLYIYLTFPSTAPTYYFLLKIMQRPINHEIKSPRVKFVSLDNVKPLHVMSLVTG